MNRWDPQTCHVAIASTRVEPNFYCALLITGVCSKLDKVNGKAIIGWQIIFHLTQVVSQCHA